MVDYEILREMGAGIFNVLSKAQALERTGQEVLHFEIGQPDFPTPEHIKKAAKDALDSNFTGYVAAGGIFELKQAIQEEIEKTRGFIPSLNQIIILPGGNSGIYFILRSIIEHQYEEIIYPNPGFPSYASVVNYLGNGDVNIPLKETNEFRFNPNDIEEQITPKTKVIILNSPQNPTGSVMKKEEIQKVADLAEEHGIFILSDEVYSKMLYDEEFFSCSIQDECKERTIILESFSKSYSMCGWRLGWAVGPEWIIDRMNLLISMGVSCTTSFVQKAGIRALKGPQDELKERMKIFRTRRDAIARGLNDVPGFSCLTPQGAFYVFPNIIQTGLTSQECADHLLENGVACLPGTTFGKHGEGYLRFSYATSLETINKAIKWIKNSF